MVDSLAECQIEGCHEPARYLIFQAQKDLYVCEQHFCLLGGLKEGNGVVALRNRPADSSGAHRGPSSRLGTPEAS